MYDYRYLNSLFNTSERVDGTGWDTSDDIANGIQNKSLGENSRGELSRRPHE